MASTNIGSLAVQITGSTTGLSTALKTAENDVKKSTTKMAKEVQGKSIGGKLLGGLGKGMGGAASMIGHPITMAAGGAASLLGGISLSGFLLDSIKIAAEMEDIAASFKTLLGSAAEGDALFRQIEDTADGMRMNVKDAAEAAKDLLGVDVEGDQITPTLRMLGDLALGDAEKMKTLAAAYAQVKDTGEVTERTLKAFRGAGIAIGPELAKSFGVGRNELSMLIEDGKIGFRDLQKALMNMTGEGGKFFGGIAARADTLKGKLDMLQNSWSDFKWDLGQMLIDEFGLKGIVDSLTGALDTGRDNLEEMRPLVREIATAFKEAAKSAFIMGMEMARAIAQTMDMIDRLGDKGKDDSIFSITGNMRTGAKGLNNLNRSLGGGKSSSDPGQWEAGFNKIINQLKPLFDMELPKKSFGEEIWDGMAKAAKEAGKVHESMKLAAVEASKKDLEIGRGIRERMDPLGQMRKELHEMGELGVRGGFGAGADENTMNFARMEIFNKFADKMGGQLQIASAAMKDSSEAIEAIARNRMGQGKEDRVAQFLEQANIQRKVMIDNARELNKQLAAKKLLVIEGEIK